MGRGNPLEKVKFMSPTAESWRGHLWLTVVVSIV